MASDNETHPDLYRDPSKILDPAELNKVIEGNVRHERLYQAVKYVLNEELGLLKHTLPERFDHYPSKDMSREQRAQFGAVYGIMVADNFEDPSLGKKKRSSDDALTPPYTSVATPGKTHKDTVIVTRRFANAVVEAVQEHTSRAKLYESVYKFMLDTKAPSDTTGSTTGTTTSS